MPTDARDKEFIFIDESGDPGIEGSSHYFLVAVHLKEGRLTRVREHLTAFRYHHGMFREFKDLKWADTYNPTTKQFLEPLAQMTEQGLIVATGNWINKAVYKSNWGPYMRSAGESIQFRNFQIRRLLERHHARSPWGVDLDVVLDRWRLTPAQRRNLEDYLLDNLRLRPMISSVTMVDSSYSDFIQVADIYVKRLRRLVFGEGDEEEANLCSRLIDVREIQRGLY